MEDLRPVDLDRARVGVLILFAVIHDGQAAGAASDADEQLDVSLRLDLRSGAPRFRDVAKSNIWVEGSKSRRNLGP